MTISPHKITCTKCGKEIHIPPMCRKCLDIEREAKADTERIKLEEKIERRSIQ